MIRLVNMLLRVAARLVVFYLVVIGLIATGGFAGVGPLADDLADQEPPLLLPSVEEISDSLFGTAEEIENQTVDQNATGVDEQAVERLIHEEINDERNANGLDPLATDADLRDAARGHSADMIADGYVGHESPDGVTPADRLSAAGCSAGGENVAQTWFDRPVDTGDGTVVVESEQELASHLVDSWMASPGHRENVLRESFAETGVGVLITDDNKIYATQKFCMGSAVGGLF